jgi:glycosyltransferase involved in cell wall biosynthesis
MRIAINARFSGYPNAEGYARFIRGVMTPLVRSFPQDEFVFLADQQNLQPVISASNTSSIGAGPMARHPLLWKYWYDFVLPGLARKANADCLFSPDGFCSLNSSIPQVLAIHDLAFLHYPEGISRLQLAYYNYYTPKFIRAAKQVITVSEFSREDIIQHYPQAKNKISVVPNAADESFAPLPMEDKELCKQRISGGREYFLYMGSIHPRKNLMTLLKGFSWFKKRHQSNMKLVLAGRMAWKNESFITQLETYKYREDVVLAGYLEEKEMKAVMASAYALVYPSMWEGFGLPLLEAMKSGVPLIAANNSALPEIAGSAAFYADPADAEAWGRGMGLIYKDETYRSKLIENGFERASFYSWDKSALALYEVLLKAVS